MRRLSSGGRHKDAFSHNSQQQQEKMMTMQEEYVLQSMHVICEEAEELFRLHPGLREFKVVRLKDGQAKVRMSKKRRPDFIWLATLG
jgi:hypothetical protein